MLTASGAITSHIERLDLAADLPDWNKNKRQCRICCFDFSILARVNNWISNQSMSVCTSTHGVRAHITHF